MVGLFLHVKGYFASKRGGWRTSETGELVFEEVRIPLGNLLGEEKRGF
jgi:acyl-CoA dehydrogenase